MDRRNRWWTWTALVLLACTAAIPLAAPLFPTQDGPVHLYYADVLRGVLTHSAPYAQHFRIKSLLTPYASEYYCLLALESLFSPGWSEKLLVIGYIFAFGLGFRHLVESVAEKGSPWTIAGLPFCLHMLLYMGFLNYSLALAVLLFQCGCWIRYADGLTARRVAVLTGGLVLMLLTHPVPAAIFLTFAGLYTLTQMAYDIAAGEPWRELWRLRRAPLALSVTMGLVSLAWVSRFLERVHHGAFDRSYVSMWGWFNAVATELQLYPVAPFNRLRDRAAAMALLAFTGVALGVGLWRNRRNIRPPASALLVSSGICFLLYCVVPERMNDAFYFAERFPILWVLFLLAGTAALPLSHRWSIAAGGLAVCVTVTLLVQQRANVAEIGSQIARMQQLPPPKAGSVGLIAAASTETPHGLQFHPYMWSAVHYFRRSQAILANDPWMNSPLIMLAPARADRWSYLDPGDASKALMSGKVSEADTGDLDFVVQMGPPDSGIDGLMHRYGWSDAGRPNGWVRVYRRP
jgi:hypothetical protein